jgi:hypothetical protein
MTLTVPGFFSQDLVYDMVATFNDVLAHFAEPHHARIRLTEVCRLWKTQVKKMPHIWNTINISGEISSKVHLIQERFRLAKGCPIDLCLRPVTWFEDPNSKNRAALIETVASVVKSHIKQIRVLIIDTEELSPSEGASLLQIFPFQAVVELPELEVLCIADDCILNQNLPMIQAPRLSWIIMDNCGYNICNKLTDGSLTSIQQLMISSSEQIPYDSISRLSLCPNLISLHWSYFERQDLDLDSDSDETEVFQDQLRLPSLQTLCLYIESPDQREQLRFLKCLQTPTLVSLTFCGGVISDNAASALSLILCSGLPYLQNLSLKDFTIDDDGHQDIFDGVPQLRVISCTFCHFGKSFFAGLAPVAVGKLPACPLLEGLSLVRAHFYVPEITRLVKARGVPWDHGGKAGVLQRVHIASCRSTVPKAQKEELRRVQESYGHILVVERSLH